MNEFIWDFLSEYQNSTSLRLSDWKVLFNSEFRELARELIEIDGNKSDDEKK